MKVIRFVMAIVFVGMVVVAAGCAHIPGGVAASSTPLDGRDYSVVGREIETDSLIYFLGFIPVTGGNSIRDAMDAAIKKRGGDAMINITVDYYSQWWFLFSRYSTIVEGDVIRFK